MAQVSRSNRTVSRILDEPQLAAINLTTTAGPSNTNAQKNRPLSGSPDEPQPADVNITPTATVVTSTTATAVDISTMATAVNIGTIAGPSNSNNENTSDSPPPYEN